MEGNQLLFSIEGKINSTQPLCQPCILHFDVFHFTPSLHEKRQPDTKRGPEGSGTDYRGATHVQGRRKCAKGDYSPNFQPIFWSAL